MSSVKLDDGFAESEPVIRAGPLAAFLHVAALCYCHRQLTDGRLPRRVALRLVDYDAAADLATALVDAGLWRTTDDGWAIVDYTQTQPSRLHVLDVRAKRQVSGQRAGRASGVARRTKAEAKSNENANQSGSRATGRRASGSPPGGSVHLVAATPNVRCAEHDQSLPCVGCAADRKAGH